MSNLKAKNKKTGEIVEYVIDNRLITHCVGSYAYTKDQFSELYEVVEDKGQGVSDMLYRPNYQPVVEDKETWRDRFETEFADPDTGLLNIGKYDHDRIINFINNEMK